MDGESPGNAAAEALKIIPDKRGKCGPRGKSDAFVEMHGIYVGARDSQAYGLATQFDKAGERVAQHLIPDMSAA